MACSEFVNYPVRCEVSCSGCIQVRVQPRRLESRGFGAIPLRRTTFAPAPQNLTLQTSDPRVRLALTLLQKNAMAPSARISDIADELHISSTHLRHLFKREVGMTPTHYVKVLRLQEARKLLETALLSVKEVMAAVGFSDLSHFVRDYKAQYGVTPSQSRTFTK
ncbi:MAG: cdhR 1 [Acidobacteriaceae bacterium]|nr:cdhR 1 [Acidobacteriaceae bacterium]